MSGIVGIINLDGAPVDRRLLQKMTGSMTFRGPDAQDIWIDGHVGFGHTMLRTTRESLSEHQPYSLDGQVWITADARVDGRTDLIQKLGSKVSYGLESATDVELILHAYQVWTEDCVKHLIGDFVFAIWDGRRQCLFCARDHFGVKPFYYTHVRNSLIFSNTLDCVRMHPAVSDELNDLAIADFLLFGFNQDLATTTFVDIRRLPPAHYITWSDEWGLNLKRYWTLPIDGHIRYKRVSEYVDHFRELLRTAVNDRLRTNRVGISMSGGLDSTSVAVMAYEILSERQENSDLRAYTIVYDRLIRDEERYYSGLVGEVLRIPIHYLVADDYTLYERWDKPELRTPEPTDNPLAALLVDQYKQIGAHSRVLLRGSGGDALLSMSRSYFIDLLKGLRFGRLLKEVGGYVWSYRRLPPLNFRSSLKRWMRLERPLWQTPFPAWLNPAFAAHFDLGARWEQANRESELSHPTHTDAYQNLLLPLWPSYFESCDPGVTLHTIEIRQVFFDIRLVDYVLGVPLIPWSIDKEFLRTAMCGTLPEAVRLRSKALLAGDPVLELLRHSNTQWIDHFDPVPELAKYVIQSKIPRFSEPKAQEDIYGCYLNLRTYTLNHWLRHLGSYKYKQVKTRAGGYE